VREEEFAEAALLAFRLNRLRDFYLVMSRVVQNQGGKADAVDFVIQDKAKVVEQNPILSKIVGLLVKEDKKRLLEILRNLNSKSQYASLAQSLMAHVLPRFKSEEYLQDFKENAQELKETLKVTLFYTQKHLEKADRNLKKSYYPGHILA